MNRNDNPSQIPEYVKQAWDSAPAEERMKELRIIRDHEAEKEDPFLPALVTDVELENIARLPFESLPEEMQHYAWGRLARKLGNENPSTPKH